MIKHQFFCQFIYKIDILSLLWYNENTVWEVFTASDAFRKMRASPRLCQIALNGQRQFDTGNAKSALFSLPTLF